MKQLYTLDEIHDYDADIRNTEMQLRTAMLQGNIETINQLQTRVNIMHDVSIHMHDSLKKHGPLRPGIITRMFTVRKSHKTNKEQSI